MRPAKPTLALLRELTDENVLTALMNAPRLTRAELAVTTGLSKPTVAESVRRLVELRLVTDTGERTANRGGVGTYYALAQDVGVALAVSIAPEGIVAEVLTAAGVCLARSDEPVVRPASPATVERLLFRTARAATRGFEPAMVRAAVVSAADPVDRASGALVHLPDAPFLLGALSPSETLSPLVGGAVIVDNDANWAARSERDAREIAGGDLLDDFVYLYLGEGLGSAVVTDGQVRRGHAGLAGEVAHVLTEGADGQVATITGVLEHLGLHSLGTTAIDVDRLHDRLSASGGDQLAIVLARALGGVLSAAIAFCDPSTIVLGGPWGNHDAVFREVRRHAAALPRPVSVERAVVADEPSLAGARKAGVDALRADILSRAIG